MRKKSRNKSDICDRYVSPILYKSVCRESLWWRNYAFTAGQIVVRGELYQLRKSALTAMVGQTDLKTLMEFSGHTQVSTIIGNYVFATSESMKSAVNRMDALRPK